MKIDDRLSEVHRVLDQIDLLPREKPVNLLGQARSYFQKSDPREIALSLIGQSDMLITELGSGFGLKGSASKYELAIRRLASETNS